MAHNIRVRILLPPSICRSIRALVCSNSAPAPSDLACSLQGLVLPLGAKEMVGARSQYNGGQGEEGFMACRSNAIRSRMMMRAVPPVRATATSALLLATASHPPGGKSRTQDNYKKDGTNLTLYSWWWNQTDLEYFGTSFGLAWNKFWLICYSIVHECKPVIVSNLYKFCMSCVLYGLFY